jgi:hypothetical protein
MVICEACAGKLQRTLGTLFSTLLSGNSKDTHFVIRRHHMKIRFWRIVTAVLACGMVLAACGSGGGGGGGFVTAPSGASAAKGDKSVAYSVLYSAPVGSCPNGGITVNAGIDTSGNGVLDLSEVTSTQYVCNGASGTNGSSAAVSLITLPTGSMGCANGGTDVCVGPDADGDHAPDSITSCQAVCNGVNGNNSPIANAGSDQKVAAAGIQVTLDGSGSSDPDGSLPTYVWSFTTRPVGSLAALSSSSVVNPTFTPDKAGVYTLSLLVNDGQVNSPADTVTVRAGQPVPDTGQTRWYSTVYGDDGDYTINPMSYTDNGDGTIFDNVTGLTWQKCSVGQSGLDCATGTAATYDWTTAGTTCGNLNLAGTGWRLPTDFELTTLVDYGVYNPAIDTAYFPATVSSVYWSSTTYAPDTTYAWGVYFSYGSAYGNVKTVTNYVRCVRGQ